MCQTFRIFYSIQYIWIQCDATGGHNALSTFQWVLTWVFHDRIRLDVHVWFNDIFIGTDSIQEHNNRLLWVFECLKSEYLYISRKKFDPYAPVLNILRCKIDSNGIHADSNKLIKIRNWRTPKDHMEVLQFLGLIEYLACFLPNIGAYMGPLQNICTNHMPFFWMPLHQKCFDKIKTITCKTPILKPIIWEVPPGTSEDNKLKYQVWVIMDACPADVSAVLAQGKSWMISCPTAFMSKKIHTHAKVIFWVWIRSIRRTRSSY